ncbi:MAG: NADAR family protein [Clostridia bacterium]|nr:NADAR family protein [Clostridia bacterium]
MTVINKFREEYFFLSNFYKAPVEYHGLRYLNNEAAFQAQKCLSDEEKQQFLFTDPARAKRLGRKVSLRADWETVKVGIMEDIVRAKFTQNPDLKELLLATGDTELVEGNTWNDTFWGVNIQSGKGQNHLGKILMKIRKELR